MAQLKWPYSKDPDSDLDYIVDWSEWLKGDTIQSSVWEVPNELISTGDSHNDTVTTIWLADGESGNSYKLTNTITTVGGRTAQRDITLKVKER